MTERYAHARAIIMLLYLLQGLFAVCVSFIFTDASHDVIFAVGIFWVVSFFIIILLMMARSLSTLSFGLLVMICSCVIGLSGVYIFETVISLLCLFIVQTTCLVMLESQRLLRISMIVQILCVALLGVQRILGIYEYITVLQFISVVGVILFSGWVSYNYINFLMENRFLSEEYERSNDSLRYLAEIKSEEANASSRAKSNFLSNMLKSAKII